ncbi:MAG: hypothetical protein AAF098_04520 [Pseudomonadota bacterium]
MAIRSLSVSALVLAISWTAAISLLAPTWAQQMGAAFGELRTQMPLGAL